MSDVIRIVIIDDHPVVREGLTAVLNNQPDIMVIGSAGSLAEASATVRRLRPDVLLLDLELPDGSGEELVPALLSEWPQVRVLVFTAYDTDERVFAALRAGAKGYLLKGAPGAEIARAIRILHEGGSYLEPRVTARVLSGIRGGAAKAKPEAVVLSERERKVLRLVVDGLSNKQIASALGITERTAKFHVSSLLRKLDVGNRARAAALAVHRGLV